MKKVFSTIKSFLKETDILLFSLCVITSAFGLLMVYSATRYTLKDGAHFSREFIIMLLAIFLGIIAALFLSYFDYQVYTKFWPVIAVFCVIIMLVLFKWGTGPSSSPTFAIVNVYGEHNELCHFDMYRVESWDDLYSTGFFDYIDMGSVLCVEWSENVENALPENTVRVYIEKGDSDNARIIRIDGVKDENSLC